MTGYRSRSKLVLTICLFLAAMSSCHAAAVPEAQETDNHNYLRVGGPRELLMGGPPQQHMGRSICADSTSFRTKVYRESTKEWEVKDCTYVAKKPYERCEIMGTDNNGYKVPAKGACFASCDTGNCRWAGVDCTNGSIHQAIRVGCDPFG